MYATYINKSTVVASEDYRSVSQFGQEMRLAGIQGVKVARWTGKTAPKYSCLAVAQSKFADYVAQQNITTE